LRQRRISSSACAARGSEEQPILCAQGTGPADGLWPFHMKIAMSPENVGGREGGRMQRMERKRKDERENVCGGARERERDTQSQGESRRDIHTQTDTYL